jgi:hypothetical protein
LPRRAGRSLSTHTQHTHTHDFIDKELGKAIPYGIYDVGRDEGWVSVGISADTAQFAVAAIGRWWQHLGRKRYPTAQTLTIAADCGGSNGYRIRRWKTELQALADRTGLRIRVMHYPPGTSKWNKMRPKVPALTEALAGHFGSHHAVACRRILAHLDFLNDTIGALTEQIDARTASFEAVYKSLLPVPGFDRLTIDVSIAETGADI